MSSYFGGDFDRVIHWLRKRVPKFKLVTTDRLVDEDYESLLGEVYQNPKTHEWVMRLSRNQSHESAIESALHEAAHLIVFDRDGYESNHNKHHSRAWGIVYADLYRAFDAANEKGEL